MSCTPRSAGIALLRTLSDACLLHRGEASRAYAKGSFFSKGWRVLKIKRETKNEAKPHYAITRVSFVGQF
jgi:hypothetical protein